MHPYIILLMYQECDPINMTHYPHLVDKYSHIQSITLKIFFSEIPQFGRRLVLISRDIFRHLKLEIVLAIPASNE